MRRVRTVRIRDKVWQIRPGKPRAPDTVGECIDPGSPGKYIQVDPSLKGRDRLEVWIHELLHAAFWDLSESAVERSATDIAHALWRLGTRWADE